MNTRLKTRKLKTPEDVHAKTESHTRRRHAANLVMGVFGHMRRHWLLATAATLLVAISTLSTPAWAGPVAAPLNQTVPRATPTAPFNEVVPTATPRPADDDTDDEGSPSAPGGSTGGSGSETTDPDSVPFQMPASPGASTGASVVPQTGEELTAVVSVGTLNVREGPGTGFRVIGTFSLNQVVTIEARNQENSWWYVCCLPNTETRGWVSAPLLQTNFDRAQSAQLIPVFGQTEGQQAEAAAQPAATATPQTVASTLPMSLTLSHTPSFVWQGKTFDINFTVTNPNDRALRNLEISNEVGAGLTFVAASGEGAPTIIERETAAGGVLVIIRWPTIPADAIVNGKLTVTVDPTLPNGAVLDNLAAARATNGAYTTAGITLGLPPAGLPDFQ